MTGLDYAILFLLTLLIFTVVADANDRYEPPDKWRKY
jgi:hypothetical protein